MKTAWMITILVGLVLDACMAAPAATEIRAYDFGPKDSPVWPAFMGVDNTAYSETAGQGWKTRHSITLFKQKGPHPGFVGGLQDPLVVDGLHTRSTALPEFCVDLPNGEYSVWLLTSLYRRSFCNSVWGRHEIRAEGKTAWQMDVEVNNFFDIYYRDAQRNIDKAFFAEGVWKRYLKPWLDDWRRFDVTVEDGQLNVAMTMAKDKVHAMIVAPPHLRTAAQAMVDKVSHDREEWFNERWKEELPPPTADPAPVSAEDRARGYVVFGKHWMDEVFPSTRPTSAELNPTLKLMATPGEREPVAFGVRAVKDLTGIQVSPTDLTGPNGARIPKTNVEHWYMRYEARPYPGGTFKVIPVALEQRRGLGLDADITRVFFLKVLVPEEAPAGIYEGKVTFKPANAPAAEIPLKIRVLPFRLAYPSEVSFCAEFASVARYLRPRLHDPEIKRRHWDWVRRYFRSLREHNMTSLHINTMPAAVVKGDTVTLDFDGGGREYCNLNKLMDIYQETGFTGPNVIYQGFMAICCWGLRMHPASVGLEVFQSPRGQSLLKQAAEQVTAHAKARGWPGMILYATGEPTNFRQGVEKAIATFKAMRQAPGVICAMSSINDRDHAAFPYLDVILFGSPSQNNMGEKMKAQGKKIIGYNSGITRLSYGFYVWRIGAIGRTQEHFQSTIKDRPFNDFLGTSSCWSYTHMAFGPEGPRPCPRLEHQAEGIDDYRYVLTLEQLVSRAEKKGGAAAERAGQAKELLKRVWRNVPGDMRVFYSRGGTWEPGVYDRLRSRLAREIMTLQEALR